MSKSVRELLHEHILATQQRIDELRTELAPLEREIADARVALAVIGDPEKIAESNVQRSFRIGFARQPRLYGGGEQQAIEPSPQSPYEKLTMKQLVRTALAEHFPNGATANEMLELFHHAWGRNDVVRTSLSPQLSRLKRERVITLHGMKWRLAGEGADVDNENGAPATLPLDAPEADGGATPSNHQPERTDW
jgi:hypothetical protein